MKNTKLYTGLLAMAILGLVSCKNKLDVLAPGEEAVSVYGILNPSASVQNIRINKVYLTDGDAIAMGQDANAINYGPGELTVSLQRFMSGSTTPTVTSIGSGTVATKKEIVLTETVVTTQSGNFSQTQRIWQTTDKLFATGEYKLIIKHGDKEFTAQNVVVDSVKSYGSMPFIYYYHPNPSLAYPMHGQYVTGGVPGTNTDQRAYVDYKTPGITHRVKFRSVPNARLYNVVIRFYYIDSLIGGGVNHRFADFEFPTIKSNTLDGSEELEVSFLAEQFFDNLALKISSDVSNIRNRKADYLEYNISAGAESLSEFLQVNAPSTTIAQDKPYYTNIKGGVGIFSSKSRSIITKDMWYEFIDKIACYPSTHPLLFCNSAGVTTAVCQ